MEISQIEDNSCLVLASAAAYSLYGILITVRPVAQVDALLPI